MRLIAISGVVFLSVVAGCAIDELPAGPVDAGPDAAPTCQELGTCPDAAPPPGGEFPGCAGQEHIQVPDAERQRVDCLPDLTTAGLDGQHTDRNDWSGLHASGTQNPSGVPGVQIDGYFPDTSTSNANHGWYHDSQFVIRLPDTWNGKLIITGAPGVRKQYANDFIISDWVVARGYAYASTDKGNTGLGFYADGEAPGDAIAEWNHRVTELAIAAKQVVAQRYGAPPSRTYVTGISNGGYLARWQIENRPELYDGAVDWEGTLQTPDVNLLHYLPATLEHYLAYRRGDAAAHQAILHAGFAPGSEFLWEYHYTVYWDLTQRIYREEFDPAYDGELAGGIPFCQSGTPSCDADYDVESRPPAVRDAVAKGSLTGRIGKPTVTLHGTLDALLPISRNADVYAHMVTGAGQGGLHRYYVVEGGNHVDGLYGTYPDRLRPILPCYRAAFLALERWVEGGEAPPASRTIARPTGGDLVNECELAGDPAPAPAIGTSFPEDFPVILDHSLGVPIIGFGGAGPVTRTPVVFLHGNNDTPYPTACNGAFGKIQQFAQYFLDHGYAPSELWALGYQGDQCDLPTAPTNRSGEAHSTVANVPDLRAFVHAVLAYTGASQVDLVGHSLGGIVLREWMRQDDAHALVRRAVAVDSPHLGIINCSPNPRNYWQSPALGGFDPDSAICREFGAPDTPLLAGLASANPPPDRFLTIRNADTSFVFFASQDGSIPPVPAEDREGRPHDFSESARLPGARNVDVVGQGRYDDTLGTAHLGIVNSPEVWQHALDFLKSSG